MAVVAQKTPCLILDEPTNHLDITYQLELLDIVKSLNITVISAIHDLNMAAMFCDRLYVLRDGQILSSGTPEEVLTTQMIREVYHVESQIVYDADGHMHILYLQNGDVMDMDPSSLYSLKTAAESVSETAPRATSRGA